MYVSIVVHVSVEEDLVSSSIIQPFPLQQLATIFFTFIYSFVHVCICGGACVPQLAGVGAFYYMVHCVRLGGKHRHLLSRLACLYLSIEDGSH